MYIFHLDQNTTTSKAPPPPTGGSPGTGWARGSGFHHKSHRGKRINCLLWDNRGDQLYSVCEGGTVVLARNLRPRRGGPAVGVAGITGVVSETFLCDDGRLLWPRSLDCG